MHTGTQRVQDRPQVRATELTGKSVPLAFALTALVVALLMPGGNARAALLCDCTQVVDSCSASVGLAGNTVQIESDNKSCSRVDYLIEGQPFTALVVGGSSQTAWPGLPQRDATIIVENCRVCAESGAGATSTAAGADTAADDSAAAEDAGKLQPIIKVMPSYPREALMNRIEGDVLVEFSVNQQGNVQNIRVLSSSNPVLDIPTIDAISRFRYQPASADGKPEVTTGVKEKFRFRLIDGGTRADVTSVAQ